MRHSLLCLRRQPLASGSRPQTRRQLPAPGTPVELEQHFVGSSLEVNRHAILVNVALGRELLTPGDRSPGSFAVIDAKQEYGVDRLLELDSA